MLCEAAEFERDMRTILLPGLLEHQQAIHEDSTDRWKMILQDIYHQVQIETLKQFIVGQCSRLNVLLQLDHHSHCHNVHGFSVVSLGMMEASYWLT